MQEFRADAVIHANGARNFLHIATGLFAKICNLIDEGYFHRKKCIGCIFDDFGIFQRRDNHRRLTQIKRAIKPLHSSLAALIINANHHTVRTHEIFNRRSFAQKFRV
ncbi:hypothetical protein FQZ97_1076890 [compost metagenome]